MRRSALAVLLAAPLLASANLVNNGSFEANAQANNSWNIYSSLTGWTGVGYGIELRNNVAGAAFDGKNFVELDTTRNSAMFQNINTSLGQKYDLSFAYSPRQGVSADSNGIEVLWNDISLGTYTASGVGNSGNVWSIKNLSVTGAATASKLTFMAVGTSNSYGGSLDAVSLTSAVPEPETYAMMMAGLAAVGFLARRRRQA